MDDYKHYIKNSQLSPIARKLAEAVSGGSIAAAIKNDPSLAEGLDEYTQWRDKVSQEIGGKSSPRPVGHEIRRLVIPLDWSKRPKLPKTQKRPK